MPSIGGQARSAVEAFKRYLNARVALALSEADDLIQRLKVLIVFAAVALVLAIMLAFTLEITVFALLVTTLGWSWPVAGLALAGLHLVILVILGLLIKNRVKFQAFPLSRRVSDDAVEKAAAKDAAVRAEEHVPQPPPAFPTAPTTPTAPAAPESELR